MSVNSCHKNDFCDISSYRPIAYPNGNMQKLCMELSQTHDRRMRSGKFVKFLGLIGSIRYWSNYAKSTKSENGRQRRACKRKGTNIPALRADMILCDG